MIGPTVGTNRKVSESFPYSIFSGLVRGDALDSAKGVQIDHIILETESRYLSKQSPRETQLFLGSRLLLKTTRVFNGQVLRIALSN